MKIEIWSDIMCPFCYIGKRHLEAALNDFQYREEVEIIWKSYQLDPTIPKTLKEEMNLNDYLSERKGISPEQAALMNERVSEMAASVGLKYRLDKAIIANSWMAHQVIQLAKEKGLGDEIEERFFQAYFLEGINLGVKSELIRLGMEIGLDPSLVSEALEKETFAYQVTQDIQEGANLGVRGVPFFVFDRKYGISGAEPIAIFKQTLEQCYQTK